MDYAQGKAPTIPLRMNTRSLQRLYHDGQGPAEEERRQHYEPAFRHEALSSPSMQTLPIAAFSASFGDCQKSCEAWK